MSTWICVPRSSTEYTVTLPSSASTLSRIDSRPTPECAPPGRPIVLWVEADAVVAHRERDVAGARVDVEDRARGVCVAGNVGERFLHDAVDRGLDLRRKPLLDAVDVGDDAHARCLEVRLDVPAHRRGEAEVVEHRRPQVVDQKAKLRQAVVHDLAGGDDVLERHGARVHRLLGDIEVEQRRSQRLARLVVQLAADASPLVLDGLEDLGRVGARLQRHAVEHRREGFDDGAEVGVGHRLRRYRLIQAAGRLMLAIVWLSSSSGRNALRSTR